MAIVRKRYLYLFGAFVRTMAREAGLWMRMREKEKKREKEQEGGRGKNYFAS